MIWNIIPTKVVLYAAVVIALLHLTGIYPMTELWADIWNIIGGFIEGIINDIIDSVNPV